MQREAIVGVLERMDAAHRADGGYILVAALRRWSETLDDADRADLWDVLLDIIKQPHETLWGVALELLVEEQPENIGARIIDLLKTSEQGDRWKDQLVLALLRLALKPSAPICIKHITDALATKRLNVLPLLAALCRVDPEACLQVSSNHFGVALKSADTAENNRGYIPAFIRNFMAVDKHLLPELVRRTRTIDTVSGNRLNDMVSDILGKPVFIRDFGKADVAALQEILKQLKAL